MDETKLKQFIEQIMRLAPKFYLEVSGSDEEMAARLREAAATLWQASRSGDTTKLKQSTRELEGQLLVAQSVGRLSAKEAETMLDELHELAQEAESSVD